MKEEKTKTQPIKEKSIEKLKVEVYSSQQNLAWSYLEYNQDILDQIIEKAKERSQSND